MPDNIRYQAFALFCDLLGGERGIRTPGTSRYNGFQDRRIRPLCHFSAAKVEIFFFIQKKYKKIFFFKF